MIKLIKYHGYFMLFIRKASTYLILNNLVNSSNNCSKLPHISKVLADMVLKMNYLVKIIYLGARIFTKVARKVDRK